MRRSNILAHMGEDRIINPKLQIIDRVGMEQ